MKKETSAVGVLGDALSKAFSSTALLKTAVEEIARLSTLTKDHGLPKDVAGRFNEINKIARCTMAGKLWIFEKKRKSKRGS